jgi:hypothetical protein
MADFIHIDATVDASTAEAEAMPTVNVAYTDNAPQGVPSFTCQLSSSNPDFTLSGLKSHLVENLVKKPKVQSGPLLPLAPLPSALAVLSSLRFSSPQNSRKTDAIPTKLGPSSRGYPHARSAVVSAP